MSATGPDRLRGLARIGSPVLASAMMTRNTALRESFAVPALLADRSIVLVGLMGAGKTSIGRRLAARLGLPFHDADAEIELAAGCTVPELFTRFGEREFRDGERRVIRRLLSGDKLVLATGGGAYMDPQTRNTIRREAICVWLRADLPVLLRRVAGRTHRPLLNSGAPAEVLHRLMGERHPVYAEADVIVDCGDENPETTTGRVLDALCAWRPPRRLSLSLSAGNYDVVIGEGLLGRAGAHARRRAAAEALRGGDRRDGREPPFAHTSGRAGADRHRRLVDRREARRGLEKP